MSEYVTLTIDGANVRAPRGTSVLDVALDYGICIPHLCHVRSLTPIGVCRVCIVELVKNGRSKITTSCTLEVEEGMVILAHSEKIIILLIDGMRYKGNSQQGGDYFCGQGHAFRFEKACYGSGGYTNQDRDRRVKKYEVVRSEIKAKAYRQKRKE